MATKTTRVVHVDDNVPDAIYVGRPNPRRGLKGSLWANPYKIGDRMVVGEGRMTRAFVIRRYRADLMQGPKQHLLAELPDLRGKPLACWCRHDSEVKTDDNACHADVLVDVLNQFTDDELRKLGSDE